MSLSLAVGCSSDSSKSPYSADRAPNGDCVLTSNSDGRTVVVPPAQSVTTFLDDGRALSINGAECALGTTRAAVLTPVPAGATAGEYLKIFWGAFSELTAPGTYEDVSVTLHADTAGMSAAPGASYSAWLGLQPPLDLEHTKDESLAQWRKENKWGNLAIHPTVQMGALGGFTRVRAESFDQASPYVFNTFCDAGIGTCPIDGPANIVSSDDGAIEMGQRVYHTGNEHIFPQSWIAETRDGASSTLFVVRDQSVRAIFDDPDFCRGHPCRLPVALLEQEIRARDPLTLEEIPRLFPRAFSWRIERLATSDPGEQVAWSFPKSFEMTGSLLGDKVVLSVADLTAHLAGLAPSDATFPPLNCVHALLLDLQTSRESVEGLDEFVWTMSGGAPAVCDPAFYP